MSSAGIYEATNSLEWAMLLVVVRKANRAVRLVGDYSITVNLAIVPEDYPYLTSRNYSTILGAASFI